MFGDNAVMNKIVNRTPFQAMANNMVGDWHDMLVKEEKKAENWRGNLQMDPGFSMKSRVDKASVPGMNVSTRLRQCGKYDYIPPNGDEYKK